MRIFKDFEGRRVRLTDERLDHILEHPEMRDMVKAIEDTVVDPQKVVGSLSDEQARMYYRYYFGTKVGDKFLCVVVKIYDRDAFVLTAYLTNKVKRGKILWPKKT